MASIGASPREGDTRSSLEKIKRQLASGSGRNLLQGPLLKRSETLRKWNERWVILDPTTGKMEYKLRRNEPTTKGNIVFDANSTITISPVNFHGLPKYDGCCIYIGTPQKKDYFLCAETPGAAKAWVSTLQEEQSLAAGLWLRVWHDDMEVMGMSYFNRLPFKRLMATYIKSF